MKISLIAAVDLNGLLGQGGRMPWHLPAELDHLRRRTMGKPIIMGRRTFEVLETPLAGRKNIVLSREKSSGGKGYTIASTLAESLEIAKNTGGEEVMVAGGRAVYKQTLPEADKIYLSVIQAEFEGDVYFPEFNCENWDQNLLEEHPEDENNEWPFRVYRLDRKQA